MPGDTYIQQVCDERHKDNERRIESLEKSFESNLIRIYTRFDEVSAAMMKRLPIWVTLVIGILGSACSALAVAVLTKKG